MVIVFLGALTQRTHPSAVGQVRQRGEGERRRGAEGAKSICPLHMEARATTFGLTPCDDAARNGPPMPAWMTGCGGNSAQAKKEFDAAVNALFEEARAKRTSIAEKSN